MYIIGEQPLGETPVSVSQLSTPPIPYYRWKVEVEGVKTWHIHGFDCSIKSGKASDTIKGMGKAELNFAVLDVPIISQDRVNMYYNSEKVYSGYVDKIPDLSGGKVSISPDSKKFETAVYNADYTSTNATYQQIIQDVLSDKQSQTDILYNASLIDIDDTTAKSIDYNYKSVKTLLNDIVDQLDDRYAGADANQFYFIKTLSTSIKYYLYNSENPAFQDITVTEDDSKIKATRYQVYQKSTSGSETNRLGQVGYDSSTGDYPSLSIENRIGIKEKKYTAPEGLNSSNALNFAYTKLKAETVIPTNIKIKGLDLRRIPVKIGDRIRGYKPETLLWRTIIDCESTSNWLGNAELSTIAKKDTYSITFSGLGGIHYGYPELKQWRKIQKIGFYIRSNKSVTCRVDIANYAQAYGYVNYSMGNYSFGNSTGTDEMNSTYFNVYVGNVNQWIWYDTPITCDDFRYISFSSTDQNATIWIDEIKLYQYHRQFYDGNVIQIDYELGSDFVNVQAGEFQEFVNDDFFNLQKELEQQKIIQEA